MHFQAQPMFSFLSLKLTIVFFKQMARTRMKIFEESCACGVVRRPIQKKTDHFLHSSRKKQNHFVKLILGIVTTFQVSK